jgi:regulatory protein
MAGTVTAVEVQAKRRNRVNVYLNNTFAFGLTALVAEQAGLRPGVFLSDDQISRLLDDNTLQQAMDTSLNFLSYRPRSEREVRSNLQRKKIPEALIERVMERLKRSGLVDDSAFARFWTENRASFSPRGERAIKAELRQKGVETDVIQTAVGSAELDEESNAYTVALKKARSLRGLDQRAFWQRLSGHLARRGFGYDVIHPVVTRLWREAESDAEDPTE